MASRLAWLLKLLLLLQFLGKMEEKRRRVYVISLIFFRKESREVADANKIAAQNRSSRVNRKARFSNSVFAISAKSQNAKCLIGRFSAFFGPFNCRRCSRKRLALNSVSVNGPFWSYCFLPFCLQASIVARCSLNRSLSFSSAITIAVGTTLNLAAKSSNPAPTLGRISSYEVPSRRCDSRCSHSLLPSF